MRRMLALVPDEAARDQIDLVRALYDRGTVERTPPHVPLTGPVDAGYGLGELEQMLEVVLGLFQPFMLELAAPGAWFDGDEHLLQVTASQGGDEARRLAGMLYRDLFPEQAPTEIERPRSPIERTALTLGRFRREREAAEAASALAEQRYFLVITHAGIFDEEALPAEGANDGGDPERAWTLRRSLPLGGMLIE